MARAFSWEFCLCVSLLRPRKGQHKNKFDPHLFPGQSKEVVMFLGLQTRRPCTRVKLLKMGEEGFGVAKPPFPTNPETFPVVPHREWGFPDSNCPFSGWWEMGVFRPRNPRFPNWGFWPLYRVGSFAILCPPIFPAPEKNKENIS